MRLLVVQTRERIKQGLIHRVESLNAFIGCPDPGTDHTAELLLCRDCGCATEIDNAGVTEAVRKMH